MPNPSNTIKPDSATIINNAVTKTNADNLLREAGVAVDGHIIENGKFRPERGPPYVTPLRRRKRTL
jgi:hypothetical protein